MTDLTPGFSFIPNLQAYCQHMVILVFYFDSTYQTSVTLLPCGSLFLFCLIQYHIIAEKFSGYFLEADQTGEGLRVPLGHAIVF